MNELAKKEAGNIMVVFYVIFDLIFTHSPHASRHMARQILDLIKNSFSLFFLSTDLKIQEISSWCLT